MYIILSCRVNSILKPNSLIGQLIIYKALVFAFPLRHLKLHPCLNITVRVNSCKYSHTENVKYDSFRPFSVQKNKNKKKQTKKNKHVFALT